MVENFCEVLDPVYHLTEVFTELTNVCLSFYLVKLSNAGNETGVAEWRSWANCAPREPTIARPNVCSLLFWTLVVFLNADGGGR